MKFHGRNRHRIRIRSQLQQIQVVQRHFPKFWGKILNLKKYCILCTYLCIFGYKLTFPWDSANAEIRAGKIFGKCLCKASPDTGAKLAKALVLTGGAAKCQKNIYVIVLKD